MLFIHSLRVDGAEVFRYESNIPAACPDVAKSIISLYKATHDVKGEIFVVTRSYNYYYYHVMVNDALFNIYGNKQDAEKMADTLKVAGFPFVKVTIKESARLIKETRYYE